MQQILISPKLYRCRLSQVTCGDSQQVQDVVSEVCIVVETISQLWSRVHVPIVTPNLATLEVTKHRPLPRPFSPLAICCIATSQALLTEQAKWRVALFMLH
jgi:hypothetical protein